MPIPVNFGVNFSLGRIELCEVKQPRGPDALGFRPMTARSCVIRETPFIGSPFIESIPPQVWTALRRNLKAASPFKASASIRYSGYVEASRYKRRLPAGSLQCLDLRSGRQPRNRRDPVGLVTR